MTEPEPDLFPRKPWPLRSRYRRSWPSVLRVLVLLSGAGIARVIGGPGWVLGYMVALMALGLLGLFLARRRL